MLTIAVGVLLLHGLALDAAESGPVEVGTPGSSRSASLSVRWIEAPVAAVADAPAAPPPKAVHVVRRAPAPSGPVAPVTAAPLAVLADAAPPAAPAPAPAEPTDRPGDAAAPSTVDQGTAVRPAGPIAPDMPIPVYKTRLPPAMTLHYELHRSGIVGEGILQWRPAAADYELRLEGRIAGITLLTQTSQGAIDAHGIAPLRFTDQRTRRPAQAANFQRDKGIISFSGPPDQYVLVPGVQDRLSWMLQLGAIVAAEPARARPGQKVVLDVVGSRGEVDTWALDFVGTEAVQAAGATVQALKFMREARKPQDSQVEIWLDPARHDLPVHARLTGGTDVFELLLTGVDSAR